MSPSSSTHSSSTPVPPPQRLVPTITTTSSFPSSSSPSSASPTTAAAAAANNNNNTPLPSHSTSDFHNDPSLDTGLRKHNALPAPRSKPAAAHASPLLDALDTRVGPTLSQPASTTTSSLSPQASQGAAIEMDNITRAGHRRRRSSLMQNSRSFSAERVNRSRAGSVRAPTGGLAEEPKISEEDPDDVAPASAAPKYDANEDSFSDEDLQDDEETGLTKKDKRRRKQKKRRNTLLDQRIVKGGDITAEEKSEADKDVVRKLLINASLILLWYLFSLSISLYNKWMFDKERLGFSFPLFTTSCHMLVQFALSGLVLFFIPSLRPNHAPHNSDGGRSRHEPEPEKPSMTWFFYLTRIGPCGTATGLDIGLGNASLKFITLTFYTMCKSSSLAFVLLFAFLFRLETPTWKLVGIIATMTLGVLLMVSGEVEFEFGGFALVISAAFFSGFRWALTQILLLRNPATSNPFSSIFFIAPVMFVVLFAIAVPVEGFPALFEGLKGLTAEWGLVMTPFFLLFPGCIAFLMTASEFALLQRTSVVTLSIAGIFKEVVTISAATLVFEDHLTPVNAIGLIVTMIAIIAYNYIKITKMRQEAQQDIHRDHMAEDDTPSHSGLSDDEDNNSGEDAGLLGRPRRSAEYEDNLITADGDIFPNPAQEAQQEAQESRTAEANRNK